MILYDLLECVCVDVLCSVAVCCLLVAPCRHVSPPVDHVTHTCCPLIVRMRIAAHVQPEGEDELKKMQLMELAIINGTFRTNEQVQAAQLAMAQKLQAVRKSIPTPPTPQRTSNPSPPHTLPCVHTTPPHT